MIWFLYQEKTCVCLLSIGVYGNLINISHRKPCNWIEKYQLNTVSLWPWAGSKLTLTHDPHQDSGRVLNPDPTDWVSS